jgi:hypothetical protein
LSKRLNTSLIAGAVLGVVCIAGLAVRSGGLAGKELYAVALWYNRVIMGLVVGLAGAWQIVQTPANRYLRGALVGLLISAAFFLSTGMRDVVSFLAGIVYGLIIEVVAYRYA